MKIKKIYAGITLLLLFINLNAQVKTWYDSAQIRIDSIRKGNFTFKVVDKDGNAVQDSVKIKHVKHEFSFGVAYDFSSNGNFGNSYTSGSPVKCKSDTVVYVTERYGKVLNYLLPAKAGNKYKLALKFAEIYYTSAGKRIFDVYINDEKRLSNFDIYKEANSAFQALDTSFIITASDSVIKVGLIALTDNAKINGIALYDSTGNPLVLANCGGPETYTQEGLFVSDIIYMDKNAVSLTPTIDDWGTAVMYKYFNSSVTGNPFKWSGIEADSGILKYDLVDAAVNWGTKVGFDYRGHTLMWGATSSTDYHELPKWVHSLLSKNKQLAWSACKNRVTRDAGKYKNFFKEYDVLNEPLHAKVLQTAIGDSINWYLFKWAHEAAPNVKLYVNEYNVEWTGSSAYDYKTLINKMIINGAHVDGIGVQAHMYTHPNPKYNNFVQNGDNNYDINIPDLKRNMDILASLGLPIKFTEFDLDTMNQVKQAFNYARMMRFAFSYPASNGLVFWSLTEPSWQPWIGGMFDSKKRPKLVLDTIYNLLHNVWTTKIYDRSEADGFYKFRGYYGKYEISVKTLNGWKTYTVPYTKDNQDSVFILKEDKGGAERPVFQFARIINRNQIELKFDKKMADPSLSSHYFKVFNDLVTSIDSAKIKNDDSTVIILSTKNPVKSGYYITVGYVSGKQVSVDNGVLESFGPEVVLNPYPALVSAVSSTDGKTVILKFNQPMTDPSGEMSNFIIVAGSVSHTINSISYTEANDSIFVVSLQDSIKYAEKASISYTPGTLSSENNFELDAISKFTIVNNVSKSTIVETVIRPKFQVYPNPANNIVNVKGTAMIDKIVFTDLLGQIVKAIDIRSESAQIDISDLRGSTYVLSIFSKNSVITRSILLKK